MRFLNKHAAREKQLRRFDRELWRLRRLDDTSSMLPLEHLQPCGWTKTYALAAGVDRRPDAPIYQSILTAINRTVYAPDRNFVDPHTLRPIVLEPRVLHVREVEEHGWPVQHRRLFELGSWRNEAVAAGDRRRHAWSIGYKLVKRDWLREEIQPHLVTHTRVERSDAKSRLAELDAHMTRTCGWKKLNRLFGRSDHWRCETRAEAQASHSLTEQLRESTPD